MTEKDLRRLGKTDLLTILRDQQAEIETLHTERAELLERLSVKAVAVEESGSIAEAALALNGVFQAAQAAADQYLESVRAREADTEYRMSQREAQAEREILARLERTEELCRAREADSQKRAEQFWQGLEQRLERLYESHRGLQELLETSGITISIPRLGITTEENPPEKDEDADETKKTGTPDAGAAGTGASAETA